MQAVARVVAALSTRLIVSRNSNCMSRVPESVAHMQRTQVHTAQENGTWEVNAAMITFVVTMCVLWTVHTMRLLVYIHSLYSINTHIVCVKHDTNPCMRMLLLDT